MRESMAGYGPLLAATLRTLTPRVLAWVLGVPSLAAGSAAAYDWVLPDEQSKRGLDLAVHSNPAFKLIFGPSTGMSTRDGFTSWHSLTLGCFFTAVMATLLVVGSSRADEDSGQAELIASGTVGRGTRLYVAQTLAVLASLAVAVLTLAATVAAGGTFGSSAVLAAGFAASGVVFGAVAALAVQLGGSASTARALGLGTLAITYMVRGWTDAGDTSAWATWTTPIAWIQHTRPAADDDWRPLLLPVLATVVITLAAQALQRRRDFGLGMLTPAPGPARGNVVATPLGFVWRLNRGSVLAWLVALTVLGAEFGNVATSISGLLSANPDLALIIAAGATTESEVTAGFVLVVVTLLGIIAALPGIQVIARLGVEEDEHRLEPVLAGAISRHAALAVTLVVALATSAAAMLLGGAGLAAVASVQGVSLSSSDLLWQAVACVPAVWSLVALASASVGLARWMAPLGWAGATAAFALTILGPLFKLDDRVLSISPYWHVPNVAVGTPSWTATCVVCLATVVLLTVAFAGFRHRDLH